MHSKHITNVLSRGFGKFAKKRHSPKLQALINGAYTKMMKLDMSEFDEPKSYRSLNELFTRAFVKDRQIDTADIISPADSFVTDQGFVEEDTLFQIKGMSYKLSELLPHIEGLESFEKASYINLYLSPSDYHRYHSPANLKLTRLTHIPGKLYPVNIPFLKKKPNLFIENERVVIEAIDSKNNPFVMVFIGALNVGKMRFVHLAGFESNVSVEKITSYELNEDVKIGDLLGWFEMGSSIVLIAHKDSVTLDQLIDKKLRFGEKIGCLK